MMYTVAASPSTIGTMEVKNRFVMPPMVRNYATPKGLVNKRYADHIERIARGGVGMMILEASYIRPDGKGFMNELGIHDDATIPGLRRLVKAAHKHDAKIGIQLYHAGRQTSKNTTGKRPIGPSAIADPVTNEVPKPLTQAEIASVVRAFAKAAARAQKAGMDFVELHGAHGYLITQFLSPFSNKRTDKYGGSFQNRLRFMEEVIVAVRKAVGPEYPVVIRLTADEMVPGGLRLSDSKKIAKHAEKHGVDAIHVSVGNYASYAQGKMLPPMAIPDGPLLPYAAGIKQAVSIPIIAVGKIRTPEMAESLLKTKKADFVAIGRSLLADPDYPNKALKGKQASINPCIACNQGCISRLFAQQDVWCTVNPACGREGAFEKKAGRKKKVLVVGGGPGGLTAAKIAAERGHRVTLYEKTNTLGGQVIAAAKLPHRADWDLFTKHLIKDVKTAGVTVKLKTTLTATTVRKNQYDAAIVAVGSSSMPPAIPGITDRPVLNARDIIEGNARVNGDVVIVGGGCLGAQTAELLAQRGHKVTLIEATKDVAVEAPIDDRMLLLGRLKALRVNMLTENMVTKIMAKSVTVKSKAGAKSIKADSVVMCLGSKSNDSITNELKKRVSTVKIIGDAKNVGRVTEAVADGALAALAL